MNMEAVGQPPEVNILVVDDDSITRKFLVHSLSPLKYKVEAIDSAVRALEQLGSKTYDLLVSDVHMPEMTGLDLLTKMRENNINTPVILISATAVDNQSTEHGLLSGSVDYLHKPLSAELLRRRVQATLANIWATQSMEKYREILAQQLKSGALLQATVDQKNSEIEKLRKQMEALNQGQQRILKKIETPIEALTRTITSLLSAESLELDHVKNELTKALQIITSSDLYRPAYDKLLGEGSDLDAVTKSWVALELSLGRSNSTEAVQPALFRVQDVEGLDKWDFDIFAVKDDIIIGTAISFFVNSGLAEKFKLNLHKLHRYLVVLKDHYHDNPYHNFRHAVDVAQSCYSLLYQMEGVKYLTDLDAMALLFSAISHDVDHPGLNNAFQVNTRSELAIRYNDVSVLENHHCCTAWRLLQEPNLNFFEALSKEELAELRKCSVQSILATDMANHFEYATKFRERVESSKPLSRDEKTDRIFIAQILLKCADISNVAKPWDLSLKWSELLTDEFFGQGDHERSLGMTPAPFQDKNKSTMARNTANFIDFVSFPIFKTLAKFLPKAQLLCDLITTNRAKWEQLIQAAAKS